MLLCKKNFEDTHCKHLAGYGEVNRSTLIKLLIRAESDNYVRFENSNNNLK